MRERPQPAATPAATDFEVRVRYAETDQMRVAHHASYFVWIEAGRTEFIRAQGRSYAEVEADGWLLVVVEARCRYLHPARYDDVLIVRTRLGEIGAATLAFDYELIRAADGKILARATTVHAAVDRSGRARRIPELLRRLLSGGEALHEPPRVAEGRRGTPPGEVVPPGGFDPPRSRGAREG
jgi:acyl-CoA thioester hydrolase